ncbi:hypothetical protein Ahy_A09g044912 isoform B [Arachis hypogaea]|uniref:Uncharacterized protein n=1 Tax=Arachis hypogaea TaxID=3818 RepID=A0A445BL50_ARAHY|nr:hypothetical protein Ahy_A09g044912 isoform B [Arachis hypogaea]
MKQTVSISFGGGFLMRRLYQRLVETDAKPNPGTHIDGSPVERHSKLNQIAFYQISKSKQLAMNYITVKGTAQLEEVEDEATKM